jgi:hypothetical protein
VHYPGDYNILVPGHRDIDYREQVLIEHGVDTQVLTFTTPGVHVEPADVAVTLARQVNEFRRRRRRADYYRKCRSEWRPTDDRHSRRCGRTYYQRPDLQRQRDLWQ